MFRKLKTNINTDYRTEIPEYSDEKILEILKQRDHYQPDAANLAINEAIKRGIINSEQDLFAAEFKVQPLQVSLFPTISKQENKVKIRKSIARSLVICGVMPMVFGFIELNQGNSVVGGLILFMGMFWIFCSAQLIKAYQKVFVAVLFILSIIALGYVVVKLLLTRNIIFMDFFIPIILVSLIIYGLIFLSKISKN